MPDDNSSCNLDQLGLRWEHQYQNKFYEVLRLVILIALYLNGSILFAAEQRIALVIGNSKYLEFGTLENPANDAKGINQALKELGYATKLVIDADEATMRREVKRFASTSQGADVALVYYAGHGSQVNGENYLLPIDLETPKVDTDIQLSSIKIDDIINSLRSRIKVVLLDACRDNPALSKNLVKGRGSFRGGLAPVNAALDGGTGEGVFIAYATDSGNTASDGAGKLNSPFTSALLKNIKQPVSIDDMFSMVTREVRLNTSNKQRPYKYASLDGIFCIPASCDGKQYINTKTNYNETTQPINEKYSKILSDNIWIQVDNDSDSFLFYNPSSLAINKSRAKVKTLAYRYSNPTKEFPLDSYAETEWAADCIKNQYYMTQIDVISNNQPFGSYTWGKWDTIDANPQTPGKGSIAESIFNLACKQIKPPSISKENLQRFFSTPIDTTIDKENKKVIYYYHYDSSSIKRSGESVSVNFRISGTLPTSLLNGNEIDYREITEFYKQFKNSYSDISINFDCNSNSNKLDTYYGFNYSNELKIPLTIIANKNIEIYPTGYIDVLKGIVCKK